MLTARSISATSHRWWLEAGARPGRRDFRNLLSAFTSLSKRSNVPGLAADCRRRRAADEGLLLHRTYHGSAMSPAVQAASIAA